eukprot:TRINITY_DN1513_c0_g1_i4.p1 TRINITY_DN1513_c0_g1~~TRINITY_DN1513_c0_g1_i4.p1  ORF type:complete len:717 (+),score=111.83 TRINITY_DN1513_c0_g1_i4:68-2218(+)
MCIRDRVSTQSTWGIKMSFQKFHLAGLALICLFGLTIAQELCLVDSSGKKVPLRSIDYNISVYETLADIEITQTYFNDRDVPIETQYLLPVNPDAAFTRMEILLPNETIRMRVRGKAEAQKIYDEGKANGKTVGMGSLQESALDIMTIKVGNIPPNTTVKVVIGYTENVEVQESLFYNLIISSTLTPRYVSRLSPNTSAPITTGNVDFTWNIIATMYSSKGLEAVQSSTHDVNVDFSLGKKSARVSFKNVEKPNRNFALQFSTADIHQPTVILSEHTLFNSSETAYTAMISFMPELVSNPYSSVIISDDEVLTLRRRRLSTSRGEFIIVFDRSGSMNGRRIAKAKESVVAFLNALPSDSYFNIIIFDDKYEPYSQEGSIRTSPDSIRKATDYIYTVMDRGGTEIYDPIKYVLDTKQVNSDYPRYIFLMTDGDVSNTDQILSFVSGNLGSTKISALGIGSGASTYLVKSIAKVGKGFSYFVTDKEDVSQKVVSLMLKTISASCEKITVSYDKDLVAQAIPNPEVEQVVTVNEVYNTFIVFKPSFAQQKSADVKVSYLHPQTKKQVTFNIIVEKSTSLRTDSIMKLGIHKILKSIQEWKRSSGKISKEFYVEGDITSKDLSVRYQVLNDETAFVGVSDRTVQNANNSQFINVDNYESIDYGASNSTSIFSSSAPSPSPSPSAPSPPSAPPASTFNTSISIMLHIGYLTLLMLTFLLWQ